MGGPTRILDRRFESSARPPIQVGGEAQGEHPTPQPPPDPGAAFAHVLTVEFLLGSYYATCSCRRWVSEAQETHQRAASLDCAVEVAELLGLRNLYWLRRARIAERQD